MKMADRIARLLTSHRFPHVAPCRDNAILNSGGEQKDRASRGGGWMKSYGPHSPFKIVLSKAQCIFVPEPSYC